MQVGGVYQVRAGATYVPTHPTRRALQRDPHIVFCPALLRSTTSPFAGVNRTFKGRIDVSSLAALSLGLGLDSAPSATMGVPQDIVRTALSTQNMLCTAENREGLVLLELESMHARHERNNFSVATQFSVYTHTADEIAEGPGGMEDIMSAIEIVCLTRGVTFDRDVGIEEALEQLSEQDLVTAPLKDRLITHYRGLTEELGKFDDMASSSPSSTERNRNLRAICTHLEYIRDDAVGIINQALLGKPIARKRESKRGVRMLVRQHEGLYFDRQTGFHDGDFEIIDLPTGEELTPQKAARAILNAAEKGRKLSEDLRFRMRVLDEGYDPVVFFKLFKRNGFNPVPLPQFAQAMHTLYELRMIDKFIPEFADTRYVAHEDVHPCTVDYHMLQVFEKLIELINSGKLPLDELQEHLPILLMCALLHDVAKPREPHTRIGAEVVKNILLRMGVPLREIKLAVQLVKMHQRLTDFYFKPVRDPNDLKTIVDFALEVGDAQLLRLLYALTYADCSTIPDPTGIRSVDGLLRFMERFSDDVSAVLEYGERGIESRREAMKAALLGELQGLLLPELHTAARRHLDAFAPISRYFTEVPEVVARDVELIRDMRRIRHGYIFEAAQHPHRPNVNIVKAIAADEAQRPLFAMPEDPSFLWKMAFAFSTNLVNIVRLNIFTRTDGVSIYKFFITDHQGEQVPLSSWIHAHDLFRTLYGLNTEEAQAHISDLMPAVHKGEAAPEVKVLNEASGRFTVIELVAPDR